MLLFSIPVHEKPEVILNQVDNFLHYNPESSIVLHVSKSMGNSDYNKLLAYIKNKKDVYTNPTRLYSGWADGSIAKIHLNNMEFAVKKGIHFTHFCLHASNDMFVKAGLKEWISNCDSGYDQISVGNANPVYQQIDHFKKDIHSRILAKRYHLKRVLGSQIEGTFYTYDLVKQIVNRVNSDKYPEFWPFYNIGFHPKKNWRYWPFRFFEVLLRRLNSPVKITPFCKEEVLFPTITEDLVKQSKPYNYCYINWNNNLDITIEEIELVRSNKTAELNKLKGLYPSDAIQKEMDYFAVKRVLRDSQDPIRKYINTLQ